MKEILNHNIPLGRFPTFLEMLEMTSNLERKYNTVIWKVRRANYLMILFVYVKKNGSCQVKPYIITQCNKKYSSNSSSFTEENYNFSLEQLFTFEEKE